MVMLRPTTAPPQNDAEQLARAYRLTPDEFREWTAEASRGILRFLPREAGCSLATRHWRDRAGEHPAIGESVTLDDVRSGRWVSELMPAIASIKLLKEIIAYWRSYQWMS